MAPEIAAPRQAGQRLHLAFLDGVRGLTAFYVVLFHVIAGGRTEVTLDQPGLSLLAFGHEAVVVFIVLSGFVLTLPVGSRCDKGLPGGLATFFKRRARRILPGYYASLLLLPLFFLVLELLKHLSGEGGSWRRVADMYVNADMLAHLFLLHNLSHQWVGSINPVLWSLSTEWWIYFVFALLLVPLWRRYGLLIAVGFAVLLSLLPAILLVSDLPTLWGSPHLLTGFGLGMGAAALVLSDHLRAALHRRRRLLAAAMGLTSAAFIALAAGAPSVRSSEGTIWMTDFLVAGACALFILLAASASLDRQADGPSRIVLALLEARPLVALGRFSYSLYLTHLVVWAMLGIGLNLAPVRRLTDATLESMPARAFVVIPVLLGSAYLFFLLFERPFLPSRHDGTHRSRSRAAAEPAVY